MESRVNGNCIGCGMCANICPEVFTMTGEGTAAAPEDLVPPGWEEQAGEAADSCPVDAIELD